MILRGCPSASGNRVQAIFGTWGSALESRSSVSFPHSSVELTTAAASQLYLAIP